MLLFKADNFIIFKNLLLNFIIYIFHRNILSRAVDGQFERNNLKENKLQEI